jgi:hypothetical protein
MNTRKWLIASGTVMLAVLVMLALAVGLTQAQGPDPEGEVQPQGETDTAVIVPGAIPIQGRLTDAGGNPLDGTYNLTFRLYDVASGGTPLCSDTNSVSVEDGLFSSYMDYCYDDLDGQKVWLGVEVESDGEMTPRQVIYPVPYALSLKPVAVISYSTNSTILKVNNYGSGTGVSSHSEDGIAVSAVSNASDHEAVYGMNWSTGGGVYGGSLGGVGVYAGSLGGVGIEANSGVSVAIKASGTGIIQSTADTKIAVSPLKMVAIYYSNVEFRPDGAYMEVRPNASGFQYVYIPVDLPSVLFGTATKLKSARICYRCDQAGSYVTSTFVDNGTDSGSFTNLITDLTDRKSTNWQCYTLTDSTPNEIQGSLWIQLTLDFAGTGSAHDIRIGNITLTLTEK